MKALFDIANNAKKLDEKKILFEIYSESDIQRFILDLNRFNQIFRDGVQATGDGLTSTNSTVGVYSDYTEEVNQGESWTYEGLTRSKIAGEPYFLFDTGDFYASFKVKTNKDGSFTIKSTPKNFDEGEYGELEGLTVESTNELIQKILPIFVGKTRKILCQ